MECGLRTNYRNTLENPKCQERRDLTGIQKKMKYHQVKICTVYGQGENNMTRQIPLKSQWSVRDATEKSNPYIDRDQIIDRDSSFVIQQYSAQNTECTKRFIDSFTDISTERKKLNKQKVN